MQGPIQVTKINNNLPTKHEYTLTLTFKANTWKEKVDPDLATQMNNVFHNCREGRLPLDVEMIERAVSNIIKQAMHQACQKRAFEKYGNEMVETGENSHTSRAYLEAQKEYDSVISKHDSGRLWIDSEPNVKLERGNYECNRKN
jgi:hypothetical protein